MENKPNPPQNYLALAIISKLFCCQIFGIISIIYAAQVNSKYLAGDYSGAESASKNAKLWGFLSLGIGLLTIVVAAILFGASAIAALSEADF